MLINVTGLLRVLKAYVLVLMYVNFTHDKAWWDSLVNMSPIIKSSWEKGSSVLTSHYYWYIHIYTHISECICLYTHTHVCVYTCVYMCMCIHAYICVCIYVSVYIFIYIFIYVCIYHTYISIYFIYMYRHHIHICIYWSYCHS